MRFKNLTMTALLAAAFFTTAGWADFREFKDYEIGEEVVQMSTIKVAAGKGDQYLEGLAQTWVASNQISKDLGHIKDFKIYVSRLPESGDFNVLTIIVLNSMGDYVYTEKQSDEFMKKWGERAFKASKETAKSYPELREITGQYLWGEVEFK